MTVPLPDVTLEIAPPEPKRARCVSIEDSLPGKMARRWNFLQRFLAARAHRDIISRLEPIVDRHFQHEWLAGVSVRLRFWPNDEDRELIRRTIVAQPHRHILVTHGTDTMVETANVLADIHDKVIVLTGALNPARFQGSDAVFNIGCAVGAIQVLPDGVYIAMNGRVWDPARVRKNRDANRFEAA